MAEFLITAPNGKQYKVTGATREGALAALKRQLEGAPAQAPVNPEGTGVGRAIERGVLRTGQGLNLNTAANASQQLRSQDVDPLTSLNRILDRHLGQYPGTLEAIRNNDELQALDRVPIDAWVTQIARQYDIKPEVAERIAIDFKRIEAGKAEMREEGGRFDQIRAKGDAALAAASDKQQRIDALPMSPTAQRGAQDFQEAEGVREWASSAFKDPIGALAFIGEVAAEATPGIAAGVGTSVITGNPLAGAGVMILASSPQTFSGEFVEFLREQDIDISDPNAIKDALANDDILATAQKRGYTKAAIVGMFEALGMKGGGGILKQTFKQGFTGGAGEASSDYVLNGQIDWKEAALEAVAEVATVPGEAAVMTTRKIVNKDGSLPDLNSLSGNEKQAGADVARLLRELAQSEGYNLRDTNVSSEKGGKKALEAARKRIIDRLRVLKSDPAIKQFLSPKQRRSLAQLIDDFAPADGAFRAANNKVSDRVTQEQFDAVMRLLPPSKEASEIANLLMMSNQVTDLFNSGLKGGLSQYTDYFNPFIKDGSYDPSRAANIIIGTGAGLTLGPLATAGIVGGGRTFDFVTGRRASALDRFVRKNEKSAGLPTPRGASLIDMAQSATDAAAARKEQEAALKEQRKQESKDLNLELTRKNAPPTPDSPQDTLEVGTGLHRNNVARILRILKARNDTPPALLRAIRDYEQSVATGGKAKDLSPLIRAVKQFQQENPGYVGLDFQPNDSTRAPIVDQTPAQDSPTPDVTSEAPTFGPQLTTPENYNRGIEANRTAAQTLSLQAQNDADLSVQDKAVIASALDKLQGNLGANPVMNAEAIMEAAVNAGVPQEAIDAYVKPYVDRVARQQTRQDILPEYDQAVDPTVTSVDPKKPQAPRLDEAQIPAETRKVYKLMKVQKSRPGEVLPLFAKSGGDKGPASGYTFGEWFGAENQRPKLGNKLLAPRPGIHAVNLPVFDQGKAKVKGEQRVWVEVEIPAVSAETQAESDNSPVLPNGMRTGVQDRLIAPNESYDYKTNPNASNDAGGWPVAGSMKALRIVPDAEIEQILRDNGLDHQVENSFSDVDAAKAQELMNAAQPEFDAAVEPPSKPALQNYINPLNVPENEIDVTRLNFSPSEADIQAMRDGTYKPEQKRTLVEAAAFVHKKWKKATGREEPFEYTPENIDVISTYMATEAVNALQSDANAIGWYDRKLKAAKAVVSLVDPRVTQSPDAEAAFDFALAVTSNGQAVADNFQYAHEVFSYFMDNGKMPTDTWGKGGERNAAMTEAFSFFNAYQASGANMPIQDFLDSDFTVKELNDYISKFNAQYGTEIKVPSSEGANAPVKGSYIIGPKIGQGFYQNIRGNYDPLTMDIWWMRMWNRMVGRPFEAQKDVSKNRARIREAVKLKNQDQLEKSITNEVLSDMGIKRSALKDDAVLDDFVRRAESKYQSFFRKKSQELKGTKQKVPKPELFKATGTMVKNLDPQLQAQPKGPSERAYMRDVTKAAIAKLRDLGYDISTADFQALMWYPEKQLFRHLGVAPGRGADNDYLDAAIMLAESEGISNEQIQKALPDPDGDGAVNNQPSSPGTDEGVYRGSSGPGSVEAQPALFPALSRGNEGTAGSGDTTGSQPGGSLPVTTLGRIKQALTRHRAAYQVGKKGSEFENGIQDMETALSFAKAMGQTVRLFNSMEALNNEIDRQGLPGAGSTAAIFYKGTKLDPFGKWYLDPKAKGFEGLVFALKPGAKRPDGSRVNDTEALMYLLHEISHGLTLGNIEGGAQGKSTPFANPVSRTNDSVTPNSFAGSALYPLVMNSNFKQRDAVLEEISNVQVNLDAFTTNNPGERAAVRNVRKLIAQHDRAKAEGASESELFTYKQNLSEYAEYMENIRETAVDPVWIYLMNPSLAKKVMPKTTALIQSEFNKAKDPKIQFYSHPLAVVAAVVAAMLAQGEEDEKQKQMPPGALNQPMMPGALSA